MRIELTLPASFFGKECFSDGDISRFVGSYQYLELDDSSGSWGRGFRVIQAWATGDVCETTLTSAEVGLVLEEEKRD